MIHVIITKIPIINRVLIFAEKKIIPYKEPQNICKKYKRTYYTAIFTCYMISCGKCPSRNHYDNSRTSKSKNSFPEGIIGSIKK